MKFPSIESLYVSATKVVKRFPLVLLFAALTTFSGFILLDHKNYDNINNEIYIRLMATGNIGMVISIAFQLFAESRVRKIIAKIGLYFLAVLLSVIFFLDFYPEVGSNNWLRFFMTSIAAHLAVSFAGFISKNSMLDFWQFNKALFLRIFLSFIYSIVLFAGIAAAIATVDALFSIKIDNETYFRLWLLIAVPFNTFFFLAGVPDLQIIDNTQEEYPKALKLFTQYVLLPLATVYLFILLAYEIKIGINFMLPDGYVSFLVLGYSIFGILSLLLIYPIRNLEENKWMNYYSKFFYYFMIPILVLFVLAVYKRVADYGITEERYILIALAVWLSFITGYFIIIKKSDIRMIPISLFVVLLIANVSPVNAFIISEISQQRQLSFALKNESSQKQKEQVANITNYLVSNHGFSSVQEFVKADLEKIDQEITEKFKAKSQPEYAYQYQMKQEKLDTVLQMMGYSKFDIQNAIETYRTFKHQNAGIIDSENSIKIISINSFNDRIENNWDSLLVEGNLFLINNDSNFNLEIKSNSKEFIVFNLKELNDKLNQNFGKFTNQNNNEYLVPDSVMKLSKKLNNRFVTIRIENMYSVAKNDSSNKLSIQSYEGYLIFGK